MEFWMIQALISAVQAIVIIGGVVAVLRWSTFVTHREFKRQNEICDKRFKELAAQDHELSATLKRISKRLDNLEKHINKRFNSLEARIDNGGAK